MDTSAAGGGDVQGDAVFDPRFNNLLFSVNYLRVGSHVPTSRDFTVKVTSGEGQVWLDPAPISLPVVGTDIQGTLVMASESFPRFAPLTLTIEGADLYFQVREGQVVGWGFSAGGEEILRLRCSNLWTSAIIHRLIWPPGDQRLILMRTNAVVGWERQFEIQLLKGSIAGQVGGFRKEVGTNRVLSDRVVLQRASDGELKLRLHAARFELHFSEGYVVGFGVFDGFGRIARMGILSMPQGPVSLGVSFLSTIP